MFLSLSGAEACSATTEDEGGQGCSSQLPVSPRYVPQPSVHLYMFLTDDTSHTYIMTPDLRPDTWDFLYCTWHVFLYHIEVCKGSVITTSASMKNMLTAVLHYWVWMCFHLRGTFIFFYSCDADNCHSLSMSGSSSSRISGWWGIYTRLSLHTLPFYDIAIVEWLFYEWKHARCGTVTGDHQIYFICAHRGKTDK